MQILKNIFVVFFLQVAVVVSFAQTNTSTAISLSLDHKDWIYQLNETATFTITPLNIKDSGVLIHIEIGPEKMPPLISKDTIIKKSFAISCSGMTVPGFLRCTVATKEKDKTIKALATAAYAPERILPTAIMPDSFKLFWQTTIANAKKIPLDAKMDLLPERSTGPLNVYQISFQQFRNNSRIYGILCVPKKEGKYPAVLKVPGAGVRAYKGDTALAMQNFITLEIGVHGIPVTMNDQVYYDLASGALSDYPFINIDNKDRYYYKRVYVGCVRAIDFLLSLPQVDTSRIAVYGGSQGGALAIVTAALHPSVKYVAALYPALTDITGYLHGRAGGWPHVFAPERKNAYLNSNTLTTIAYYDVVNFASMMKIPGWYSWGYNDEICPPTTAYAACNVISAPKELFITKETGHWLDAQQQKAVTAWLVKVLQ